MASPWGFNSVPVCCNLIGEYSSIRSVVPRLRDSSLKKKLLTTHIRHSTKGCHLIGEFSSNVPHGAASAPNWEENTFYMWLAFGTIPIHAAVTGTFNLCEDLEYAGL